ncbi:MAG TPA: tetratricopeptide repeat protein [Candidatus Cloacimonadota bacterium]|nr:tetratricopeptide repeat protein [Candidatus Cloacimonadota bacterium]
MRRRLYLIIVACLFTLPIVAQYDEKQILMQQANQMMVQRQYPQAEELFLQILEKFPNDQTSILQLAFMYLNISADLKAEEHIKKYQRQIPDKTFTELRIQVLVLQGKLEEANALADSYLALYGSASNAYHMVAGYFTRRAAYDSAIRIYYLARQRHGDSIFALELANAAMQSQQYRLALEEYLRFMATQANSNLFVKNQIINIVKEDSTMITHFQQTMPVDNQIILEIYASSLSAINRPAEALAIYQQLPSTYLRDFAVEQMRQENFDLARRAYRILAESSSVDHQRLSYKLDIARIYYNQADYDSAETVLTDLLADTFWGKNTQNKRNPLYVNIRKLYAQNALANGNDTDTVRTWLAETRQYATQNQEIQDLELEQARLAILSRDFEVAERSLKSVNIPQLLDYRDYLRFMEAFLKKDSPMADSLMNEYIIRHPASQYANDIIYLNMLALAMNETQLGEFGEAVRLLQLFQPEGIDILATLYEETKDEELAILAIEWALGLDETQKAELLLAIEFQDELAGEYAKMLSLALMQDRDAEIDLAREFLKVKPNSIFSPRFRQVISRIGTTQISL